MKKCESKNSCIAPISSFLIDRFLAKRHLSPHPPIPVETTFLLPMYIITPLTNRPQMPHYKRTEQVREITDKRPNTHARYSGGWRTVEMSNIRRVLHLRVGSVQRSGDEARHTHLFIDSNSAFLIFIGDSCNRFMHWRLMAKQAEGNCCSQTRDSFSMFK